MELKSGKNLNPGNPIALGESEDPEQDHQNQNRTRLTRTEPGKPEQNKENPCRTRRTRTEPETPE